MSKRGADEVVDGKQAYLKRQKISNASQFVPPTTGEEIRSGRQLQKLLAFGQDAGQSRYGTSADYDSTARIGLIIHSHTNIQDLPPRFC